MNESEAPTSNGLVISLIWTVALLFVTVNAEYAISATVLVRESHAGWHYVVPMLIDDAKIVGIDMIIFESGYKGFSN